MDIVVPREVTLPLTNGRSVTVWAELNHGQYIAMLSRMFTESKGGELRRDVLKTTDATVIAYLIDWTLTDPQGQRIAVRGRPPDEVQDILNNLRQATALEVKQAIEAHHAAVEAAGEALKKPRLPTPYRQHPCRLPAQRPELGDRADLAGVHLCDSHG